MADILYFAPVMQGSGDGLSWASAKALTAAALDAAVAEVGPGGRIYLRGNAGDNYALTATLALTRGGTERAPVFITMQQTDNTPAHETAWLSGVRPSFEVLADLELTTNVATWDAVPVDLFTLQAGAHWLTFTGLRVRNVSGFVFDVEASITGLNVNDLTGFNVKRLVWDTFPLHKLEISRVNVTGFSSTLVRIDKPASSDIEIIGPSVWDSRRQINDTSGHPRALAIVAGRRFLIDNLIGYRGHTMSGGVRADGVYMEQDALQVVMKNCQMHGFAGSGFLITFNGQNTFDNLQATDNAYNFTFSGSASAVLPNLVSRSPNLRGHTAPARHLWVTGNNATVDVSGGIFRGGGTLVVFGYASNNQGFAAHYLDMSQSASARAARSGAAAQALDAVTQVASGRYRATGSGVHNGENMLVVQDAQGGVLVKGSRVQVIPAITQIAYSGTEPRNARQGTAVQALPRFDQVADAFLSETPARSGTAAHTIPAFAQVATGNAIVAGTRSGTAAQSVPVLISSGGATVVVRGSAAHGAFVLTQGATGSLTVVRGGAAAQTLAALSQTASGKAIASALGAQTLAVTSTAAGNATGTFAQQDLLEYNDVSRRAATSSAAYTTPTFTPASNSLLVAIINVTDYNATASTTPLDTVTGGGLTWTKRLGAGDVETVLEVWTAPVATGAAMQLTVDHPGALAQCSIQLLNYTGYDTASPIGAAIISNSVAANGAVTLTLPSAPDTASYVVAGRSASGAGTLVQAATPGAGWLELMDTSAHGTGPGAGGLQVMYRTGSASTAVTWDDINVNDVNDYGTVAFALEIRKSGTAGTGGGGGTPSGSGFSSGFASGFK